MPSGSWLHLNKRTWRETHTYLFVHGKKKSLHLILAKANKTQFLMNTSLILFKAETEEDLA